MGLTHLTFEEVNANGIRLHFAQVGPEDGPLVILLHGFPEFWYGWRHQLLPLAEAGWRVVAPDQRGYNRSAKPAGISSYQIHLLAADVIGLMDCLKQEKCLLVGHDWGAAVAWEAALRYPDRITKLAILNVPHPDVMRRFLLGSLKQMLKSWYIFFFQAPWLPERLLLAGNCVGLKQMMRASSKPGTFSDEDLASYVQAWQQPGALTSMLNWYRAAFRSAAKGPYRRSRIHMRRVTTPTLMLWGEKDVALDKAMAQPSSQLCDRGELVFFPKASHWVQHEEAHSVNQHLIEFMRS